MDRDPVGTRCDPVAALRVVILSPEMTAKKCKGSQLGESVMGIAVDGATATDGSGRIAYIFADRIGQTTLQYLAKFERALASKSSVKCA